MEDITKKKRRFLILGYGAVARATIPVIAKECKDRITEMVIIDMIKVDEKEAEKFLPVKATFIQRKFEKKNYVQDVLSYIQDGDMVCEFFGATATLDLIKGLKTKKDIVYGNASVEFFEEDMSPDDDQVTYTKLTLDAIAEIQPKFTVFVDCGMNPGMVTHFAIMGLKRMAQDAIKRGVKDADIIKGFLDKNDLPNLCKQLQVDVVHSSDHEFTIVPGLEKFDDKFVSSWCATSFIEEYGQRGCASVGTHDVEDLSKEGYVRNDTFKIPYVCTPFPTFLKTASPFGPFTGRVTMHGETIEIARLFSTPDHIPTVTFVYRPSNIMLDQFKKKDWEKLPRTIYTEENSHPLTGRELVGATLISSRDDIPVRWYGSVLDCQQSRDVGCTTNPTTLQVTAGYISALKYALDHTEMGFCYPGAFPSEKIMEYAAPYLGTIFDDNLDFKLPIHWKDFISDEDHYINDKLPK